MSIQIRDRALIQIVDSAMSEAARKSGAWLLCRPGCTQCCIGPFAISQLDAARLRGGLAELQARDAERAEGVRERARRSAARFTLAFPGDPITGLLAEVGADEPCPVLDPETGTCDLYEARPMTCRTFGPPVRCGAESVGVCELCFKGASDEEISACEVEIEDDGLEAALLTELQQVTGVHEETTVAFCLSLAAIGAESTGL